MDKYIFLPKILKNSFYLCLVLMLYSCVEQIDPDNNLPIEDTSFENALVVDARLTDQNKKQSIFLSRVFSFSEVEPRQERNATVYLDDNMGSRYNFIETSPGTYSSEVALELQPQMNYVLNIETSDGQRYVSDEVSLTGEADITNLMARRSSNDLAIEGVSILVDSRANTGKTGYFRYEYEETYQVIAPDFNPFEWDEVDYDYFMNDNDGWEVTVKPREEEARICYATSKSRDLILANTSATASGELFDFEIRFIEMDNYVISHRFSILVKQYHHSAEAYSYFKTLQDFSSQEDIFSNIQPGFLQGNIRAVNSDIPVIGYFEVSSYSDQRMYLNFEDIFPGEQAPGYLINCDPVGKPPLYPEGFHATIIDGEVVLDGVANSPLIDGILDGSIAYIGENPTYLQPDGDGNPDRAPFLVKAVGCVDCKTFGSEIPPDFWIE